MDGSPPRQVLRELPSVVRFAVRLVNAAARREMAWFVAMQLMISATLLAQVLLARRLFGVLLSHRSGHLSGALPTVGMLTAAVLVSAVATVVRVELQPLISERVTRHALRRVVDMAARVDLRQMDDTPYHDHLQRAVVNASVRVLQMVNGLSALGGSLVAVIALGVSLLVVAPLLVPFAAVAAVPVLVASLRSGRAFYQFNADQTPLDRQRTYLQFLLTRKESAKDIRSYNLADYLRGRFSDLYDARITALAGVVRTRLRRGVLGAALGAALSGGALALIIVLVDDGRMSLASAGAAAGALILLGSQLQSLSVGIGQLYESALYVRDYAAFVMESPDTTLRTAPGWQAGVRTAPESFRTITVEHVTFAYPNSTGPALCDVSLSIPNGGLVALVGENGSGKTTVAKLLAGLYQPDQGHIAWDGTDIAEFDPASLRDRISALFQDFTQFHVSARNNITWGRVERETDDAWLAASLDRTQAREFLEALPDGLETHLSPEFLGGVELSGGQWQRVALARAMFRDASLIILDEPTASLDPRAEAALFDRVREIFADRAVLLITHRMFSARHADHIYVLDRGRMLEHGGHEELMAARGRYAELFELQQSAFNDPHPARRPPPSGSRSSQ